MRMLYKIVLGLLLFNAFLTLFNPLFTSALDVETGYADDAINYTSSDMTDYSITNVTSIVELIFSPENLGALAAGGAALVAAMLVAFATKNYVIIGVGLFVAIVVSMYTKMSSVIANIGSQTNNIYVDGIIAIISIAIGVLIIFAVIDMFAPASARE